MSRESADLEITVLRSIKEGMSIEDMAHHSKVPAAALGKAIATLQIRGLLNDDGSVSEAGNEALAKAPRKEG